MISSVGRLAPVRLRLGLAAHFLKIQLHFDQLSDFPVKFLDCMRGLLLSGESVLVPTKELGKR